MLDAIVTGFETIERLFVFHTGDGTLGGLI